MIPEDVSWWRNDRLVDDASVTDGRNTVLRASCTSAVGEYAMCTMTDGIYTTGKR